MKVERRLNLVSVIFSYISSTPITLSFGIMESLIQVHMIHKVFIVDLIFLIYSVILKVPTS